MAQWLCHTPVGSVSGSDPRLAVFAGFLELFDHSATILAVYGRQLNDRSFQVLSLKVSKCSKKLKSLFNPPAASVTYTKMHFLLTFEKISKT